MGETTKDELTITLKFTGTADAVVSALVHGLPQDALREVAEAFTAEVAKRAAAREPELVGSEK
jgi:hypothetical protein